MNLYDAAVSLHISSLGGLPTLTPEEEEGGSRSPLAVEAAAEFFWEGGFGEGVDAALDMPHIGSMPHGQDPAVREAQRGLQGAVHRLMWYLCHGPRREEHAMKQFAGVLAEQGDGYWDDYEMATSRAVVELYYPHRSFFKMLQQLFRGVREATRKALHSRFVALAVALAGQGQPGGHPGPQLGGLLRNLLESGFQR
jgi:hypothetical protein